MDSGFAGGEDETYNVYDQPFRGGRDMASNIYRPSKNIEKDTYTDDFETLMQNNRCCGLLFFCFVKFLTHLLYEYCYLNIYMIISLFTFRFDSVVTGGFFLALRPFQPYYYKWSTIWKTWQRKELFKSLHTCNTWTGTRLGSSLCGGKMPYGDILILTNTTTQECVDILFHFWARLCIY